MVKFWMSRKFWAWAGKLALLAVPALISGLTSYKKAQIEAEAQSKAGYETLSAGMKDMHAEIELLDKRLDICETAQAQAKSAPVASMYAAPPKPVPVPLAPLVLAPPDAGMIGGMGMGAGRPHKKEHMAPPERFEDALMQYKAKK